VRRLLALGYPGHSGELCEIVGRDAFLEALADPVLRVRVLDQQPATLDDALAIVCRMEAYSGSGSISGDGCSDDGDRKRVRAVGGDGHPVGQETPASTRIQQLERDLAEQRREINQLRNDATRATAAATAAAAAAASTPRPDTVNYSAWQAPPVNYFAADTYWQPPPGQQNYAYAPEVAFRQPIPPTALPVPPATSGRG
jgi:hypothetical protein